MPIKAQNVFQWIKSFFDLKKIGMLHQFLIFQIFLSVKQKSWLSHRLIRHVTCIYLFVGLFSREWGQKTIKYKCFHAWYSLNPNWKSCVTENCVLFLQTSCSILFPSYVTSEPSVFILLVFSLLLPFSWSNGRWILWKWRQMCVLCDSLFNLLSLGQLLTELCMPAFFTGKSQTEHSLECRAGSWKPTSLTSTS